MALLDKLGGIAKNLGDKASEIDVSKFGDYARNIGDKASGAIETTKLNSKINKEKIAINEYMQQIGEIYYRKYQANEVDDPEMASLLSAIDEHNRIIADTYNKIDAIQSGSNQDQAGGSDTLPDPDTVCQSCGAHYLPGASTCLMCGSVKSV